MRALKSLIVSCGVVYLIGLMACDLEEGQTYEEGKVGSSCFRDGTCEPGLVCGEDFLCEWHELACGNGIIDWGEDCDDGNLANGDGCNVRCVSELTGTFLSDGDPRQNSSSNTGGAPVRQSECGNESETAEYAPGESLRIRICAVSYLDQFGNGFSNSQILQDFQNAQSYYSTLHTKIWLDLVEYITISGTSSQTDPYNQTEIDELLVDLRVYADNHWPGRCDAVVGFVNSISNSEGILGGMASFPWNGLFSAIIRVENELMVPGWTLAHELGHVFGLFHTFENDGCSDTAYDPNCWDYESGCSVTCQDGTHPPSENVMSYYFCDTSTPNSFTTCQGSRARCFVTKICETNEGDECSCTDADNDGYYSTSCSDSDCSPRMDCDDGRSSVHPGASEICGNGRDDDCSGGDEVCPPACSCTDADDDGYYSTSCSDSDCSPRIDCDDGRSSVHPGASEICGNGRDDDCSGGDEVCPPACSCTDADDDGYYSTSCSDSDCSPRMDCDDGRSSVHPGASEICGNGRDDDCSGGDAVCPPACSCTDADDDGYYSTSCSDSDCSPRMDCDDGRSSVHPGASEICGNGRDDDCSGGDAVCSPDCSVCGNRECGSYGGCNNCGSCSGCESECVSNYCQARDHDDYQCHNGDIWWMDSCDGWETIKESCNPSCSGTSRTCPQCNPNHHQRCYNGDVYWFDSCNERGSRAESCDNNENCINNGDTANCEYRVVMWTDSTTGLIWQNPPAVNSMNWQPAVEYCENLNLAGHTDWQLPTISELRTLIRGCPFTEPGGACGITEGCSYQCWSENCDICNYGEGPADGCYWDIAMQGSCEWYVSSSRITGTISDLWAVPFNNGRIGSGDESANWRVRCVR